MTSPDSTVVTGSTADQPAHLEANAIGVVQDTVIGLASSAPAASVGLTIAALAAATAYGSGPIILLTAIPMLVIANAYRRLNLWNANAGASFEWVGRSINPYLGFLTGWLMIAGYVAGTISGVEVLGPSVLAVFGSNSTSTWANIGIATAIGLLMLVLVVVGIKITARTQVGIAVVEYVILLGIAIAGLVAVFAHHTGAMHFSSGWLSLSGIGGQGSMAAGVLAAVFMFTGWDGSLYVNEEVKRRHVNPGKAAIAAVILLAIIYTVATVGLHGAVSPANLPATTASAIVYVAQSEGGGSWAKLMALSLALSVIGSTGAGILVTARITYGMAGHRTLPPFLAVVSRRYSTPVAASIVVGLLVIGLTWVYLLVTSVQNAFNDVVGMTGLLFALFYILTALATMTYYRRRIFKGVWDLITLGILPIGAIAFLVWLVVKSLQSAPAGQVWSLVGVVVVGLVLLAVARLVLKSPFFKIARESDNPGSDAGQAAEVAR